MARTDAVEPPASSAAAVAATGSVAPARLNRFSIRKKLPASFRLKAGLGTAATVATLCFTRLGYVQSMAADAPLSGSALLASAGGGSDLGGYNAREQCWDAGADQKEGAGWLVLYILVIIYLFVGMAVICDDYFGQCLEIIAKRLKLSDDVAGATFLAAGSSTPELFMAIAGTVYGSDVGIGTIVGSAVFNISIIIGLSAMFVPERTLPNGTKLKALQIDWRPLFRDLIFYSVAITMLLVFFAVSSPNEVEWWEALLLVLGYVAYVVFMTQSEGILLKCCGKGAAEDNDDGASDVGGPVEEDRRASDMDLVGNGEKNADGSSAGGKDGEEGADDDDDKPFYVPPAGCGNKILWLIVLPIKVIFTLTVPPSDSEEDLDFKWNKSPWYQLQFFMSIVHITWLSYLMHECALHMGCILGVPIHIMGLTVLAIGTSVPDALGSVFATIKGQGDMAVSNAIGSNVFDILLCLGAPWLVKIAVGLPVYVGTSGIINYAIALYGMMILVVGTMAAAKWVLTPMLGTVMFVLYFVYIILALTALS